MTENKAKKIFYVGYLLSVFLQAFANVGNIVIQIITYRNRDLSKLIDNKYLFFYTLAQLLISIIVLLKIANRENNRDIPKKIWFLPFILYLIGELWHEGNYLVYYASEYSQGLSSSYIIYVIASFLGSLTVGGISYLLLPLLLTYMDSPFLKNEAEDQNQSMYIPMFKHVLLCFLTFGIWELIWTYKTTNALNTSKDYPKYEPINKLLLCMFVPFYYIYWFYKHGQKLDSLTLEKTQRDENNSTVFLFLAIFIPIIAFILMQDKLNKLDSVKEINTTITESSEEDNIINTLTKYKELLDSGVITQEEFDAKKKQVLGL